MAINETRAVSVTFEGGPMPPVFLPLVRAERLAISSSPISRR